MLEPRFSEAWWRHEGGGAGEDGAAAAAAVDLRFASRFAALLALLRPYAALALALLSVAESLVVSQGAVERPAGAALHSCCWSAG